MAGIMAAAVFAVVVEVAAAFPVAVRSAFQAAEAEAMAAEVMAEMEDTETMVVTELAVRQAPQAVAHLADLADTGLVAMVVMDENDGGKLFEHTPELI